MILMARDIEDGTVAMRYHGKDANPKITVDVEKGGLLIKMVPPEDEVMDYYLHPQFYVTQPGVTILTEL